MPSATAHVTSSESSSRSSLPQRAQEGELQRRRRARTSTGVMIRIDDERVDPVAREEAVADVGAEDDQRALGHVDHAHHAERQRQAAGHQGVDAAGQEPEDARPGRRGARARAARAPDLALSRPASGSSARAARRSPDTPAAACRRSTRRGCRCPSGCRWRPSSGCPRSSATRPWCRVLMIVRVVDRVRLGGHVLDQLADGVGLGRAGVDRQLGRRRTSSGRRPRTPGCRPTSSRGTSRRSRRCR